MTVAEFMAMVEAQENKSVLAWSTSKDECAPLYMV